MNKRSGLYLGSLAALIALGAVVWSLLDHSPPTPAQQESGLRVLELSGPAAGADAELSGMAWWRDTLLLLPQYPERFDNTIFAIERADLERAVDGHDAPLSVRQIPFVAPPIDERENDGYEAIAVDGDDVFLTLEVRGDEDRASVGRLLRGSVEGELSRIIVDDATPGAPLEAQNRLVNIGYEALLLPPDRVIALYETNGVVNENPRALTFDRELTPRPELPVGHVEYRITDATTLDAEGRFWVANYHWPGAPWQTGTCDITQRFGQGESHARCRTVERLLELELDAQGIRPTDRAPIQLRLLDDEHPRNWEGLVRFGDRGFLIVTDEHPSTIFAFVPAP